MGVINILDSKIFNRIAAGEVVERPSSIVKEFVENSIDAGATAITISIIAGGKAEVMVYDNGKGMTEEDMKKSILPHATSKISSIEDLDNIKTLGFRGEALASIASVSKILINTATKKDEFTSQLRAEDGKVEVNLIPSHRVGTEISAANLFYNTPVRAKFLKSDRVEENEVILTVSRFILGNPFLSFKLISDGETIFQTFGEGFEASFVEVYGLDALKECYPISVSKNGITIKGYICKPEFAKGNRSHQTVLLNKRYVQNQTINSAIANAYAPYLMKRRYPYYALTITMPSEEIDCNVHPNKIDVRFKDNQVIYGTLYSIISKVLDGSKEALRIIEKADFSTPKPKTHSIYEKYKVKPEPEIFPILSFSDSAMLEVLDKTNRHRKFFEPSKRTYQTAKADPIDIFEENKKYLESLVEQEEVKPVQEKIVLTKQLKLIGQALNTYLVLEDGDDLYLIDQHAAHERILFDSYLEKVDTGIVSQPLILPYMLNTNSAESCFLSQKLGSLNEMGFEISEFGLNCFKISSVPAFLSNIDLKEFFNDLFTDLNYLKPITTKSILREKIAQKACKSAIKSGDPLSENDINLLLEKLKGDLGLKCPHGRPICVKISRTEIDKWFKRIV